MINPLIWKTLDQLHLTILQFTRQNLQIKLLKYTWELRGWKKDGILQYFSLTELIQQKLFFPILLILLFPHTIQQFKAKKDLK